LNDMGAFPIHHSSRFTSQFVDFANERLGDLLLHNIVFNQTCSFGMSVIRVQGFEEGTRKCIKGSERAFHFLRLESNNSTSLLVCEGG